MSDPKDFNELVSWASWQFIAGITSGEKLESIVWRILDSAIRWSKEQEKNQ
jgi:hypothetical protein